MEFLQDFALILFTGVVVWYFQSRAEELREINRKLRDERRNIYRDLLDPFITVLAGETKAGLKRKATTKITSVEYKKVGFDLNLFGSDEVVSAFNDLMRYSYEIEEKGEADQKKLFSLWGNFLLEIRKDIGDKKTKLKEKDMLSALIKDIDTVL